MHETAEPRRELELAAVASQQAGREGAEVEREGRQADQKCQEEVNQSWKLS